MIAKLVPIKKYRVDQTGPNTQLGGRPGGCSSSSNQSFSDKEVRKPPAEPNMSIERLHRMILEAKEEGIAKGYLNLFSIGKGLEMMSVRKLQVSLWVLIFEL